MEMPQYYDSEYYTNNYHYNSSSLDTIQTMHMYASSSTSEPNHHIHHFPNTNQYYCMATFSGHSCYISSISFAGKYLYTGSSDGEIRAWKRNPQHYEPDDDAASNTNLTNNVVAVGKGAVKSLVVLADKLFSAHQDHKIRVWRICTQDPLSKKCERIATLPTLGDRTIKLLNPGNQVQIRRHKSSTWVNHVDAVSALALSQDESILYSVSWDRTVKIWRSSDFKCLESITNAHDDAINALTVSLDGDVYTGSADQRIKVWRRGTGEIRKHHLVTTLEKHRSSVNALVHDGSLLYSGSSDKSILVWKKKNDGRGYMVSGVLKGHSKAVLCLAVAAELVCSGSADKTIRVWRSSDGGVSFNCLRVLEGHQGPVKCVAITAYPHNNTHDTSSSSTSNYMVYSGSLDCDVKVWQLSAPSY